MSFEIPLMGPEKMASLGVWAAGIAHELNNPLAVVVNNLFLVQGDFDGLRPVLEPHLPEPTSARLREMQARLVEMREGLERMKELILELRAFPRLDAGEFRTIDVAETMDSVLLMLKHKTNGRILVERNYAPARKLSCCAGPIHQVLMNLIANAADAISGEGKIVVTTGQTPDMFLISIRDSGAGIPRGIRDRIFDPFFTTKRASQGTGLGLAISNTIVQDHGGSIEVESEEGAGAEFVVKIPLGLELRRKP